MLNFIGKRLGLTKLTRDGFSPSLYISGLKGMFLKERSSGMNKIQVQYDDEQRAGGAVMTLG